MRFVAILGAALLTLTLVYCGNSTTSTPACKSDSECTASQTCDTASGTCVDNKIPADASTPTIPADASTSIPPDASTSIPPDAGPPGTDASTTGDDAGAPDASGPRGCSTTNECAIGQACDVSTGMCVTTCGPAQPCNGGCCDNTGKCQKTAPGSCGTGACISCTTGTTNHACVSDTTTGLKCGCLTEADCAEGQACNKTTHVCGASCGTGTSDCNGTCCNNGTCGNTNAACGKSCTNCAPTAAANNKVCLTGGRCGCNSNTDCATGNICDTTAHICTGCKSNTDCPVGQSCNTNNGVCSTDCTATGTCNSACCPPGAGARTCINADSACGGTCTNCGANSMGPKCLNGTCGCRASSDCGPNLACNFANQCGTTCAPIVGILCNGGCCSNGNCVAGTDMTACGATGGDCFGCAKFCCGDSCGFPKTGCP